MKPLRLPPLGALRTFHTVAECLSFKGAASQLSVSATAVSHQIRLLESALDCRVFERNAQGVRLTEAGQLLYGGTQSAFSSLQHAVQQIGLASRPQALTVTTTSNFLANWLLPRLADFNGQFPHIDVHLHTSVERIDLKQRTADVAIRYRETPESGLHNTLLYEDRFIVVSSPTLELKSIDDLSKVMLLHVDNRHIPADSPTWENWMRQHGPEALNISKGIHFSEEAHAIQAAVAGHGAVIASKLLVHDFIQRGILIAPYEASLPGGKYYLVALDEVASRPEIIALREWIQRTLAS